MSRAGLEHSAHWAGLVLALLLGACTVAPPAPPPADGLPHWSGRMALKVEGPDPSSFTSSFELKGSVPRGQLAFTNAVGTTMARIDWEPGLASLRTYTQPEYFPNLDALTRKTVGAELPVAQMFSWLQGEATDSPGWKVDLSAQAQGRIHAHRTTPLPEVDLRIILEP